MLKSNIYIEASRAADLSLTLVGTFVLCVQRANAHANYTGAHAHTETFVHGHLN